MVNSEEPLRAHRFYAIIHLEVGDNMRENGIEIVEVFNKNGYYHVRLSRGFYKMIYRAARGVYWDEETSSLYFKGDASRENALGFIAEALRDEYDVNLVL